MTPIKNISLIGDCDQETLEHAATPAKQAGARLTIVYPVRPVPDRQAHVTVGRKTIHVRDLVAREQKARLREVAKSVRALGVRATTRLLSGEPFLEVIRDVVEHQRDLVIMTAEGPAG